MKGHFQAKMRTDQGEQFSGVNSTVNRYHPVSASVINFMCNVYSIKPVW